MQKKKKKSVTSATSRWCWFQAEYQNTRRLKLLHRIISVNHFFSILTYFWCSSPLVFPTPHAPLLPIKKNISLIVVNHFKLQREKNSFSHTQVKTKTTYQPLLINWFCSLPHSVLSTSLEIIHPSEPSYRYLNFVSVSYTFPSIQTSYITISSYFFFSYLFDLFNIIPHIYNKQSLLNLIGHWLWASLVAQMVKNPLVAQEIWVWFLCWEDLLKKGMVIHSSILARKNPWTEEPGRLQSMESQRVRDDSVTNTYPWLYQIWKPNQIFISQKELIFPFSQRCSLHHWNLDRLIWFITC